MSEAPQVTVIGDALLDTVARPTESMRPDEDVPATIVVAPGGQGANVAVRLSRRGVAVRLVCGIGDDAAGRLLRQALRSEGLNLDVVAVAATGSVVIVLDASGERTMLSQRAPFGSPLLDRGLPDSPWTVVSGYLFLEPDPVRLADAAAALDGRVAVVGCAIPDGQRDSWRLALERAHPDLLVVNRQEASWLAPVDPLATCVVVTSMDSVTASTPSGSVRVAVHPIDAATDTTGAGDAFAAALVHGLVDQRWPLPLSVLEAALNAAAEVASQVAGTAGAQGRLAGEAAMVNAQ